MEAYQFEKLRADGKAYIEFVRTRDLSAGIYRLAAGAVDGQSPHQEEEIYYVVRGQSRFRAGDQDIGVKPGDILFVRPGEEHRFHQIEEDLELLVFFAPAEGSR